MVISEPATDGHKILEHFNISQLFLSLKIRQIVITGNKMRYKCYLSSCRIIVVGL